MIRKRQKVQKLLNLLFNCLYFRRNDGDLVLYRNLYNERYHFPGISHFKLFNLFFFGFENHYFNKYLVVDRGNWNPNPRTIIDCGAFVGGFSNCALARFPDASLLAVEPSIKNFECLSSNVKSQRAILLNIALGGRDEKRTFYTTTSFTDDSMSANSENADGGSYDVSVITVSTLINRYDINCDTLLLKVEAEGFELEVLNGLLDKQPKWIVIDASPELEFQDFSKDIIILLKPDYYVYQNGKMICATRIK
jgi:FkbM family methyltransferase